MKVEVELKMLMRKVKYYVAMLYKKINGLKVEVMLIYLKNIKVKVRVVELHMN